MNEETFIEHVNLFLDEEITDEQLGALEQELAASDERRALFTSYKRLHQASVIAFSALKENAAEATGAARETAPPVARSRSKIEGSGNSKVAKGGHRSKVRTHVHGSSKAKVEKLPERRRSRSRSRHKSSKLQGFAMEPSGEARPSAESSQSRGSRGSSAKLSTDNKVVYLGDKSGELGFSEYERQERRAKRPFPWHIAVAAAACFVVSILILKPIYDGSKGTFTAGSTDEVEELTPNEKAFENEGFEAREGLLVTLDANDPGDRVTSSEGSSRTPRTVILPNVQQQPTATLAEATVSSPVNASDVRSIETIEQFFKTVAPESDFSATLVNQPAGSGNDRRFDLFGRDAIRPHSFVFERDPSLSDFRTQMTVDR